MSRRFRFEFSLIYLNCVNLDRLQVFPESKLFQVCPKDKKAYFKVVVIDKLNIEAVHAKNIFLLLVPSEYK